MASDGVEFPKDTEGKRSSLAINQETFAVAVGAVDAERAAKVRELPTKRWRGKYVQHVCENVRASLTSPDAAFSVAKAGLKHLHESMRFVRDGQETSLTEAMKKYTAAKFTTRELQGTAPKRSKYGVPYKLFGQKGDLVELTGADLRVQIDKWVKQGVIEVSTAHALNKVSENPGWCDLSDQYFVLFGASSAMGPFPILMDHGANVIALDLWLPGTEKRPKGFAEVWERLFAKTKDSSGKLIFPVRGNVPKDASIEALALAAGCNLISEAPEIRTWLMPLLPKERLILFALAYLDGPLFVKVSMAMDAIIQELVTGRSQKPALAYLCTPTDCHVCTPASVTAAAANARKMSSLQSMIATVLGYAGMPLRRNVEKPVLDKQGEVLPIQIVDCIIPQQGPNYILAKRLQHWRAILARKEGCLVSSNVAPSTATQSVLSNVAFALSYKGFGYFKPLEVTYPDTSNAVMAAILISDLRDPTSNAHPDTPLENPLCLMSDKSFHGGAWRAGKKFAGIGAASLVQYGVNAFVTAPYLLGYNVYQAMGWSKAFAAVLVNLQLGSSAPALWAAAGPTVTSYQNFALMEVVHAGLGITSSNAAMTLLQIFSRVALVAVLNEFPGNFSENPWCIRAMLFAWCLTEVVRYSFYSVTQLKDLCTTIKGLLIATKKAKGDKLGEATEVFKVPFPLVWLRYSLFIILYPMGVSGEIGCLLQALTNVITMGVSKQKSAVGTLTLDYIMRPGLGSFGWTGAVVCVLIVYLLGLPPLYNMLLAARKKTLGGKPKAPRGASAKKTQ